MQFMKFVLFSTGVVVGLPRSARDPFFDLSTQEVSVHCFLTSSGMVFSTSSIDEAE
jgi:hypothetical protein